MSKRRKHSPEFKAQVGLEAIKGVKTVTEIAQEFEVHPVQVSQWKKIIQNRANEAFSKGVSSEPGLKETQKQKVALERKVGELTMDVDWLKKKCKEVNLPLDDRP